MLVPHPFGEFSVLREPGIEVLLKAVVGKVESLHKNEQKRTNKWHGLRRILNP